MYLLPPPPLLHTHTHTHTHTHNSASDNGYLEMVEYLLNNRAIAVESPVSNLTALHMACTRGHTDVAIALLNRLPALLAIDDSPNETSLHIAGREGHVEIVRNLLAVAARAKQLKSLERSHSDSDKSDAVPLYGSGTERVQRNLELLDSLGEVAVDFMAPSASDRRTPLHEAAIGGHVEVVQLIINFMREFPSGNGGEGGGGARRSTAGWSPRTDREGGMAVSPTRSDRASPLPGRHYTGSGKRPQPVAGVDLMTLRGKTAFHEASKSGHFKVMKLLLEAGADINAYMRPALDEAVNAELTALVQGCLMNRADIVRFLLQNGATDARLKALSRSLRQSYDEVAGILLCYNGGADVIIEDAKSQLSRDSARLNLAFLSVSWNSKKLKYIREGWLQTVCMEVPVSGNRTCAIAHIDISSNELTELPVMLFQLEHLTKLDASRNKLKSLPVSHDNTNRGWDCPKLAELDVSSNQLTSLPSRLFQLRELRELNASNNDITDVDIAVWTTPKLTKLFLGRNKLETFPSPKTLISPHLQTPPTILGNEKPCRESGYQSGVPVSPSPHLLTSTQLSSLSTSSGYKSFADSRNASDESLGVWGGRRMQSGLSSMLARPKGSRHGTTFGREGRRQSMGSLQSSVVSWRFKNFNDSNFEVDELDEIEREPSEDSSEGCTLEHLDLSHNLLTSVPQGLSCLAPKLQKLAISHNRIRSLGQLNDYPPNLELFDASHNELCSSITEPSLQSVFVPCARKGLILSSNTSSSCLETTFSPTSTACKPCSHRLHKSLQKLSTVRLTHNQLVDVQLFRMVSRSRTGDLTASIEESIAPSSKQRLISAELFGLRASQQASSSQKEALSKSVSVPLSSGTPSSSPASSDPRHAITKTESGDSVRVSRGGQSSNSSNSGGSQDESAVQSPSAVILSPLFPMLSTLELAHNRLHSVPHNIDRVSTLACLIVSHNPIETLPLELSNLEHLWNLEYEGCNLIHPPQQDLDKYRLASDKLLYMKSLLHE